MPYILSCSACQSKLKTMNRLDFGKSVNCPKCKTSIVVSPDNFEEQAAAQPPQSAITKDGPKSNSAEAKKTTSAPKSAATSASISSRSTVSNSAKKQESVEQDDDDDDDDKPRARKPSSKSKGNSSLSIGNKILLIAGGYIAIISVIMVLIYLFIGGSGGSGGYDSEILAIMPSNTKSIAFINFEEKKDGKKHGTPNINEFLGKSIALEYPLLDKSGIKLKDLRNEYRVSTEKNEDLKIVRLKKAVDLVKVASAATKVKLNGKSYFKFQSIFVYFPSNTLCVNSRSESLLKTILERKDSKIIIPDKLLEVVRVVSSSNEFWSADLIGKAPLSLFFSSEAMGESKYEVTRTSAASIGDLTRENAFNQSNDYEIDKNSASYSIEARGQGESSNGKHIVCVIYKNRDDLNKSVESFKKLKEKARNKLESEYKSSGLSEAQRNKFRSNLDSISISSSKNTLIVRFTFDLASIFK